MRGWWGTLQQRPQQPEQRVWGVHTAARQWACLWLLLWVGWETEEWPVSNRTAMVAVLETIVRVSGSRYQPTCSCHDPGRRWQRLRPECQVEMMSWAGFRVQPAGSAGGRRWGKVGYGWHFYPDHQGDRVAIKNNGERFEREVLENRVNISSCLY